MGRRLRYRTSVIGIVVGISIALLGLFWAAYMKELDSYEQEAMDNLSYTYQYAFTAETRSEEDYVFISNLFQEAEWTIIEEGSSLYVNQEKTEHLCRIIFSQTEELNYRLCSGRFPNKAELEMGQPVVVLGEALKDRTYSRDGQDYILICGDEYRVTGYCADKYTTIGNYSIVLFSKCLGEQTKEFVWRAGNTYTQTYTLNSNSEIKLTVFLDIQAELEKAGISSNGMTKYWSNYNGSQYRKQYLAFSYMIFGFSMFITLTVIRFWLFQRQYEFAVRRIYGYRKGQLYGMIIRELSGFVFLAFGCSIVLYGILAGCYYRLCHVVLPWRVSSFLISFLLVFAIVIVESVWVVWNTFRGKSLAAYKRG